MAMETEDGLGTSLSTSAHRCLFFAWAVIANAALASGQTPAPAQLAGREDSKCSTKARTSQGPLECMTEQVLRGDIARESQVVYPFALTGTMPTSVKLVAGTENKTASLTWSIPVSPLASLAFTASAPLSESDARTTIAQLSELANKGKAGMQLTWGRQRRPTVARAAQILTNLTAACTKARAATKNTAPGSGITETGCDLNTLAGKDPSVRTYLNEYYRTTWFGTFKAEVGREKFEFVNATTFADAFKTTYPASGSLMFGALIAPFNWFATAAVRLENGYKAADEQAVCAPPPADRSQACPVKVVGVPNSKRREVFEAEIRKFLPTPSKYPVGVSAVFRRDWRQNETSLEAPIYLVKDKDGGLSGGVSVGYVWARKKEDGGARFTLFVGQTFGLVPKGD